MAYIIIPKKYFFLTSFTQILFKAAVMVIMVTLHTLVYLTILWYNDDEYNNYDYGFLETFLSHFPYRKGAYFMSIDYIRKTLDTMRFFEKASISETFSNGVSETYTVRFLTDRLKYEVSSSLNDDTVFFDSSEAAAEWLHKKVNPAISQT